MGAHAWSCWFAWGSKAWKDRAGQDFSKKTDFVKPTRVMHAAPTPPDPTVVPVA